MMDTSLLQSCDILLYKGTDLTSHLIQWGTNSPYNHAAVVVDPQKNLAIESNTGHQMGVRALDLRKLDDKEIDVYRIRPGWAYDPDKTISYLVSCLGAPYDFGGVLWLGVLKLLHLKDHSNKWQKDKDYFCSELCYAAFNAGGLDIVPQVGEADVTSPGDISRSERIEKIALK